MRTPRESFVSVAHTHTHIHEIWQMTARSRAREGDERNLLSTAAREWQQSTSGKISLSLSLWGSLVKNKEELFSPGRPISSQSFLSSLFYFHPLSYFCARGGISASRRNGARETRSLPLLYSIVRWCMRALSKLSESDSQLRHVHSFVTHTP